MAIKILNIRNRICQKYLVSREIKINNPNKREDF